MFTVLVTNTLAYFGAKFVTAVKSFKENDQA